MAKKLFVGSLPYSTNDQSLREAFSKFGEVISASVIMEKATGRSRGFGFVEMEDAAADAAAQELNGSMFEGRRLIVNEARPMVPREQMSRTNRTNDWKTVA